MVTIRQGLAAEHRAEAVRIYWEAFGGKLGLVLGPDTRARGFLARVLRADHCFSAVDGAGRLVGVAGFKSPRGSFAGGSAADLRASYGRFGAAWRSAVLWLLSHEVDNHRFLIDGIAVARSSRGQGVGHALLEALCTEARARGYASIRLEVIDSNWRARALYERMGFVATRTERMGPLRYLFGFSAATTMVRPLS
ncbi:GNAT family N-acetyltransferase [Neotabrizicola sp. VNH66]|uniref:GNAT family N-acetyltransferase n=1 Tax=Neotabrizicola sp. VNH66 TaxID=3400918 RepID=UPI003BFC0DFB